MSPPPGKAGPQPVAPGAEEPAPPTKWAAAFEAVLKGILKDYAGQEKKVYDGMASGMRKLFQIPYPVELGALRAKRTKQAAAPLSLEDAQRVVFFPSLSDMQVYADAFAADTPDATKRREKLMKIKLLSVFYTLHRKDGGLVDRFMHVGGLKGLTALLADDNEVIQSEAVELLTEFLSPVVVSTAPSSSRQAHLHHQVYLCMRSGAFWRNFAKIIATPYDKFPRSHEQSVKILGGAVGWLRPEAGNIPEAATPPDVSEASAALQSYLSGERVEPNCQGFAEDLLAELLDGMKVREDPLPEPELSETRSDIFEAEAVAREDAAHAWQALRRLGNEAFGAGLVWPAEAAYRLALLEGAAAVPDHEAGLISSNRALVLLKAGHPGEAADAAADALARDPRNAKAAFRRAQGLLEQLAARDSGGGTWSEAAARKQAGRALEAAELAARLEPKDAKVAEIVARARQQLEDLAASQAQEEEEAPREARAKAQEEPAAAAAEQVLDEMD